VGVAAAADSCSGKKPGYKYCMSEGGEAIATCTKGGATAVDCGVSSQNGVVVYGRCYSDGGAHCEPVPTDGVCKNRRPGVYCMGTDGYTNCPHNVGLDCPSARTAEGVLVGKCFSSGSSDRNASCKLVFSYGPCKGKTFGDYCLGGGGVLSCKEDGTYAMKNCLCKTNNNKGYH